MPLSFHSARRTATHIAPPISRVLPDRPRRRTVGLVVLLMLFILLALVAAAMANASPDEVDLLTSGIEQMTASGSIRLG